MQKAIKIIASIIGLIVILAVAAVICLVSFVNPNDFKDQISAKVAAYTGRHLIIDGDIKWSFFPWLGLQINKVSLSNAVGFGERPFAQIDHADVKVELLPLFKSEVNVGKLGLDGLALNLMKNARGVTNWQDLTEHAKSQAQSTTDTRANNSKNKSSHNLKFNIEGIDINDSSVSWQNQQSGQTVVINNLSMQSGQLLLSTAFPLSLQFNIQSNQPAINGSFSLNSDVTGDPANQIYSFKNLKLTSTLNNKAYADGKLNIGLQGNIKIDAGNETLTIDSLNAKVANIQVQGNLQGKQILSHLQLQGKIQIPTFNLKQLLAALGEPLSARQDPNALTQVAATGDLQATANSFKLSQLSAQLDKTHINGNLAVTDLSKKALAFNLNIDDINVDNYSAASANNAANDDNNRATNISSTSTAAKNRALLPIEALRQLNMQGHVQIGSLHLSKLNASAVSMQLKAQNGLINLAPLTAKLYQGNYNGSVNLDVRGKTPLFTTRNELSGIQIEPATKDLINITKLQMSGVGNINMQITTQGNSETAIINHLNGQGRLALSKGIIKGINIPYWVSVGRALLDRNAPPAMAGSNQTAFGNLTGTFTMTNGLVKNNDLLIDAPTFQTKGSGTANLATQYLDYKLIVQLMEPDAHKPQGDPLPIKLAGNFSNISPQPVLEDIIKAQAKKQVEKKINSELKQRLGDDTGKAVGDAVNSLLDQFTR